MVSLYDACAALLTGCKEKKDWEKRANDWRPRNKACDRFLSLAGRIPNHPSDKAVTEAWEELEKLRGHPDARPYEPRAKDCVRRWKCLKGVLAIRDELSEASDCQYDAKWDDALLQPCPDQDAKRLRRRWEEATKRIAILSNLEKAIARTNALRAR